MRSALRLLVLSAGLLLGSAVAPASAHVVLDRSEVAAGTSADLELRAPIERPGTTNRKLLALVPGPIQVASCGVPSAAWRCTIDADSRPGDTFVTWETPVAGSPQDLRFRLRVTVPADTPTGARKLPVVQTYSDGHASRWIDDGEPTPAPRLTVIAVGEKPASAAPAPAATPHGGGPDGAGSTRPPTAAATADAPSPTARETTARPPKASVTPTASATAVVLAGPESPAARDGGLPSTAVVLAGLAVTGAGAGAVVAARRRRL